ncbi:AbrB/MazE/SpoVT family DNA-binding domain-containing protein [bacterium]|nr:AbrB/MazE/SpoVT family DNA-binding domain-containing protein [bacterium]
MSLLQLRKHHQITLPAKIRKALRLKEGDYLEAEVVDGEILLRPKELIDKDQAWFWTKEWQEGEREADEDMKAGRVKAFDNVEDLIEELDQH